MKLLRQSTILILGSLGFTPAYETFNVAYESNEIAFTYTDSGAPNGNTPYPTIFIIHGYTFHSGTFRKLSDWSNASEDDTRLLYINRRGYEGSTSYTDDEQSVLQNGTLEEQTQFLHAEGAYLGLLIDGISQALSLPGSVSVLGWSLGAAFAMAFMTSATSNIDSAAKARLQESVQSVILLEPASNVIGIKDPAEVYVPSPDMDVSSINQLYMGLAGYSKYRDLSTRNASVLDQVVPDPDKPGTLQHMTGLDLLDISTVSGGLNTVEFPFITGALEGALAALVNNSIFDPDLRNHWPNIKKNWALCGDSTLRSVVYAYWALQNRTREQLGIADATLEFLNLPGANHFVMWDDPALLMKSLAITQGLGNSSTDTSVL